MPTWKSLFSGNAARDSVLTPVVENIAGIASVLSGIHTTLRHCAALDVANITTVLGSVFSCDI